MVCRRGNQTWPKALYLGDYIMTWKTFRRFFLPAVVMLMCLLTLPGASRVAKSRPGEPSVSEEILVGVNPLLHYLNGPQISAEYPMTGQWALKTNLQIYRSFYYWGILTEVVEMLSGSEITIVELEPALRFYPGHALNGFYFGPFASAMYGYIKYPKEEVGLTEALSVCLFAEKCERTRDFSAHRVGLSIGLEVGYQWVWEWFFLDLGLKAGPGYALPEGGFFSNYGFNFSIGIPF